MNYGQEVCDFATIILFPLHCLYAGATAFTAAMIFTVGFKNHFKLDMKKDIFKAALYTFKTKNCQIDFR